VWNVTLVIVTHEMRFAEKLADQLGWGQIHRVWQMLLKGLADVQVAPDPREAARALSSAFVRRGRP